MALADLNIRRIAAWGGTGRTEAMTITSAQGQVHEYQDVTPIIVRCSHSQPKKKQAVPTPAPHLYDELVLDHVEEVASVKPGGQRHNNTPYSRFT